MRTLTILVAASVLLASCTSVQSISNLSCVPLDVPGTVRTMRITYLYDFDRDGEMEVWDHTHKYQETDMTGEARNFETPPLAILPKGTELDVTKVARMNRFDSPPDAVRVFGTLLLGTDRRRFVYLWGISNTIGYAPWESEIYDPKGSGRSVGCEI